MIFPCIGAILYSEFIEHGMPCVLYLVMPVYSLLVWAIDESSPRDPVVTISLQVFPIFFTSDSMWPVQLHFLRFISISAGVWFVLVHKVLLLTFSDHFKVMILREQKICIVFTISLVILHFGSYVITKGNEIVSKTMFLRLLTVLGTTLCMRSTLVTTGWTIGH